MNFSDLNIETNGKSSGKTFCPQCHDQRKNKKDKSLSFDTALGVYHCHHCEWKGTINDNNSPISFDEYFQNRAISKNTLNKLSVKQDGNLIKFNYYENGIHVNTKHRPLNEKKFWADKGGKSIPYNIDNVNGSDSVIITEGEMDVLSYVESGFKSVISPPFGANENLSWIPDKLNKLEKVYLSIDKDEKGNILKNALIKHFGESKCYIVDTGKYKDANELLVASGVNAIKTAVETAINIDVEEPKPIESVKFPLDVFPSEIQYIISRLKESASFEESIVASGILFVVSTLIGNQRKIKVKTSWIDTPNLWISIVGRRGTMKTPAINFCLHPLKLNENQFAMEYAAELKNYLSINKQDRDESRKPIRQQKYTIESTVEGLIKLLNENKSGIGLYKDELNGLFEEMNRYNSGGNIEFYLSAFNGGQYIKNRATVDTITISDLFLAILGSIQPEVLMKISKDNTENGMIDRWLYVVSENKIPNTTLDDIDESFVTEYVNFINRIKFSLFEQKEYEWLPGAKEEFIKVVNVYEDMMRSDETESGLFSYLSKIKTYLARFCAIITTIDDTVFISVDHIKKAKKLADYFIYTAKSTFLGFEQNKNIQIIFERENAKTKSERVEALLKNAKHLSVDNISKLCDCSRQMVYKIKNKI